MVPPLAATVAMLAGGLAGSDGESAAMSAPGALQTLPDFGDVLAQAAQDHAEAGATITVTDPPPGHKPSHTDHDDQQLTPLVLAAATTAIIPSPLPVLENRTTPPQPESTGRVTSLVGDTAQSKAATATPALILDNSVMSPGTHATGDMGSASNPMAPWRGDIQQTGHAAAIGAQKQIPSVLIQAGERSGALAAAETSSPIAVQPIPPSGTGQTHADGTRTVDPLLDATGANPAAVEHPHTPVGAPIDAQTVQVAKLAADAQTPRGERVAIGLTAPITPRTGQPYLDAKVVQAASLPADTQTPRGERVAMDTQAPSAPRTGQAHLPGDGVASANTLSGGQAIAHVSGESADVSAFSHPEFTVNVGDKGQPPTVPGEQFPTAPSSGGSGAPPRLAANPLEQVAGNRSQLQPALPHSAGEPVWADMRPEVVAAPMARQSDPAPAPESNPGVRIAPRPFPDANTLPRDSIAQVGDAVAVSPPLAPQSAADEQVSRWPGNDTADRIRLEAGSSKLLERPMQTERASITVADRQPPTPAASAASLPSQGEVQSRSNRVDQMERSGPITSLPQMRRAPLGQERTHDSSSARWGGAPPIAPAVDAAYSAPHLASVAHDSMAVPRNIDDSSQQRQPVPGPAPATKQPEAAAIASQVAHVDRPHTAAAVLGMPEHTRREGERPAPNETAPQSGIALSPPSQAASMATAAASRPTPIAQSGTLAARREVVARQVPDARPDPAHPAQIGATATAFPMRGANDPSQDAGAGGDSHQSQSHQAPEAPVSGKARRTSKEESAPLAQIAADRPIAQPTEKVVEARSPGTRVLPQFDQHTLAPIVQGVIVRHAALQVGAAGSNFRVVLAPKTLGEVVVHVRRGPDGLQVTMTPRQEDTHRLLDLHLPDLLAQLRAGDSGPVQASVQSASQSSTDHGSQGQYNSSQPSAAQPSSTQLSMNAGTSQGGDGRQSMPSPRWDPPSDGRVVASPTAGSTASPRARIAPPLPSGLARIDLQA